MATTNDLKNGMVLNLDGQLWSVVEFQHVKPGKGGAFVRTKLKNVLSGKVVDKTFNAGTKVETATVDKRDMQYLYKDGDGLRLHGHRSPTTRSTSRRRPSATARDYLLENQDAVVAMHEGTPLYVELPASVELTISYTEPGLQGDRSTGGTKPATLETGAEIEVPLFIATGEKVKVDTRDGDYLGRVTRSLTWPPGSKARKRALDVLFEAEQRGADALDDARRAGRRGRAAGRRTTPSSWSRASVAHRRAHRRAADDLRPGLDAGPDAGGRPRRAAARRPSSCCGATTCRTRWSISEAVALARDAVDRRVARLRQRPAGAAARAQADPGP